MLDYHIATGPTVTLGDGTQCTLPATYLYDATSGFYYDSSTGLYFDPKSQVSVLYCKHPLLYMLVVV